MKQLIKTKKTLRRTAVKAFGFSAEVLNWLLNVRFEVSTAVAMKNAVFWDIKTQFVPHRRHITSPVQSSAKLMQCNI
jgi:TRAP-type mannitol/chloroaromatic compound transport system substrate-binding protein